MSLAVGAVFPSTKLIQHILVFTPLIIVDDTKNIKVNFDWSFEGGKWYVIDENSETWTIIDTDRCVSDKINCDGQENTSALYLMEKEAGYTGRDWRFYKLVF